MNKLFTRLVNDKKLTRGVITCGVLMSTLSNLIVGVGIYYMAVRKGFEIYEESEANNE